MHSSLAEPWSRALPRLWSVSVQHSRLVRTVLRSNQEVVFECVFKLTDIHNRILSMSLERHQVVFKLCYKKQRMHVVYMVCMEPL